LAARGVSTVLVAGAHLASLAASERVLVMRHFQPVDGTSAARRLIRLPVAARRRIASSVAASATFAGLGRERVLEGDPDSILGRRHFLDVDATEPERPRVGGIRLDLRRSGWELDAPLVRGAWLAAAWCCRLAQGGCTLAELEQRYRALIAGRGLRALDPFDTVHVAEPPWMLVLSVLERLPAPGIR
jgi:hypothetical protein